MYRGTALVDARRGAKARMGSMTLSGFTARRAVAAGKVCLDIGVLCRIMSR